MDFGRWAGGSFGLPSAAASLRPEFLLRLLPLVLPRHFVRQGGERRQGGRRKGGGGSKERGSGRERRVPQSPETGGAGDWVGMEGDGRKGGGKRVEGIFLAVAAWLRCVCANMYLKMCVCIHVSLARLTCACVCLHVPLARRRPNMSLVIFILGLIKGGAKRVGLFALLIHTRTRRPLVTLPTIMREEVFWV
jgi:hypothetical protein